jgi:hypothetical protein
MELMSWGLTIRLLEQTRGVKQLVLGCTARER